MVLNFVGTETRFWGYDEKINIAFVFVYSG